MLRSALLAALAVSCVPAHAAGGHHAVDDAEVMEDDRCKLESWYERSSAAGRLFHLGGACGVGPLELGGATEPQRQDGASTAEHSLSAKWATEVAPGLSAGLSATPVWQAHERPRFQRTTAVTLLTWTPADNVRVHGNLGRDFVHRGGDEARGGVSTDWTPGGGAWQLAAERYRQEGGHFARVAVRWTAAKDWLVDLSRAVKLRGAGESSWSFGLTREFDR